jgi:hypothetical protein
VRRWHRWQGARWGCWRMVARRTLGLLEDGASMASVTGSARGGRGRVDSRDMALRAQLGIELQIDRPPAARRRRGGWPVGHGHTRGTSLVDLLPGRSTAAIAGVAVSRSNWSRWSSPVARHVIWFPFLMLPAVRWRQRVFSRAPSCLPPLPAWVPHEQTVLLLF